MTDRETRPCGCELWQEGSEDKINPCASTQEAIITESDDPDDYCTAYLTFIGLTEADDGEVKFEVDW